MAVAALVCGCMEQAQPTAHTVSNKAELVSCNSKQTIGERENCYAETAAQRMSPDLCDEIGSPNTRNICLQRIGRLLHDPAICVRIMKDDVRYTDCIASASS